MTPQANVQVIDAPTAAAAVLNPVRLEILAQLSQPGSSTTVGKSLGMPRQKVNYHVKELERRGLIAEVGTRQRHGCTERLLQSRARTFVIDPAALGPVQVEPGQLKDRFSSAYLIASASKTIRDVATLRRGADRVGKKVATFTMETEVTFTDPKAQAGFLDELTNAVAALAAKYHTDEPERGRTYRFSMVGHPRVPDREARHG